jgi:hypothetical protein
MGIRGRVFGLNKIFTKGSKREVTYIEKSMNLVNVIDEYVYEK